MNRPGRGAWIALLFTVLVVNLPFVHHRWQEARIDSDGVDVVAEVTETDVLRKDTDPHYVVRFKLPDDIDPKGQDWPAQVDRATYEKAEETRQIGVRVLRDRPSATKVDGEQTSALGMVIIGVVDLTLLCVGLLLWSRRRADPADPDATIET